MTGLTPLRFLPAKPKRIILHWTAGRHLATDDELDHYHLLLEHDDRHTDTVEDDLVRAVPGVPVERNMQRLSGLPAAHSDPERGYAAHTAGFNAYSIGVALCGMRGAVDYRPDRGVDPGPVPITRLQARALISTCVTLLAAYDLEPTEAELFTHYEAESLHGREQDWRWDITWLPGHDFQRDDVGPFIRQQVRRWQRGEEVEL